MTRDSKKRAVVLKVARCEFLEPRVLFSAESAPFAALLDVGDLNLVHPPATEIFEKLISNGTDQLAPIVNSVVGANSHQVNEIVLVVAGDKSIDDLIDQLKIEMLDNANVQLVVIDNDQDILKSFAEAAQLYGSLDAVHIISHAADGELRFGDQVIDQETLQNHQEDLQLLGAALNVDADILLYGCNLSSSDSGHGFARTLSLLTSADVASSSNITGHASQKGDWDLEVVEGEIETKIVASQSIQKNWLGSLDIDFGLINHYLFNGDGVDIISGDDLFFHNGVTFVPGLENQAADFGNDQNGNYKHGEFPSWLAPAFGYSDFTIAFRVQANVDDHSATLVTTNGGSIALQGMTIQTDAAGRVLFTVSDGGSSYSVTSATSINDGSWYHINAERGNNQLQLTVQQLGTGTFDSNAAGIGVGSVNLTNGKPMLFGVANTAGSLDFDGLLDDVRIYDRSLSTQDTESLATAGLGQAEQNLVNNLPVTMDIDSVEQLTSTELLTVDDDTPDSAIVYTIVNDGTDVHFQLLGSTLGVNDTFTQDDINTLKLSLVQANTGSATSGTINFSVDDGSGIVTNATFNVNFDYPTNNAPIAGDGLLPSVNEDDHSHAGESVGDLLDSSFADPDLVDALAGILVTVNPNDIDQGAWQYSTNGINWYAIDVVSEANALALSAATLLRFDPTTDYFGSVTELQFRVLDNHYTGPDFTDGSTREIVDASVNGSTTSISANLGKLSSSVVPINDSPVIANTSLTPMNEDPATEILELISDVYSATFNDIDTGSALTGIAITSNGVTSEGEWAYSEDGLTWHNISPVSASSALVLSSNYYIQFLPATHYNGTPPALELRAIDDTYSAGFTNGAAREYVNVNAYGVNGALSLADTKLDTTITPVNDGPVAADDDIAVLEGGVENKDLRLNDSDVEGDTLSVVVISNPIYGSVVVKPDGTIDYQHDGTENYIDSFTYAVNDGSLSSAVAAQVTVTITPVNEAPFIQNIVITDLDESDIAGFVVAQITATDPEGGALTVKLSGADANLFNVNAQNDIVLAQSIDHETIVSAVVDVVVSDNLGADSIAQTIILSIGDVNEAPIISGASLVGVQQNATNPPARTVADLFTTATTDEDVGDTLVGIAVSDNSEMATVGQWQYSTDQITWVYMGGLNSSTALTLSASTYIRFNPYPDYHGPVQPIEVHALDSQYNGNFSTHSPSSPVYIDVSGASTFGAISTNSAFLQTAVVDVNDRPTIGNAYLADVDEDNSAAPGSTVSSLFGSSFLDADSTDTFAGIVIVGDASTVSQGHWEYSSSANTWHDIGFVSNNTALVLDTNSLLRFVPGTQYNGQVGSLTVHGIDSSWTNGYSSGLFKTIVSVSQEPADSAVSTNTGLLETAINPVNDPPTGVSALPPLVIDENAADNAPVGTVVAQDVDDTVGFSYTLDTDANGLFDINATTGLVTVQPDAKLNHELAPSHTIDVVVTDAGGELAYTTLTVLVNDINEAPSLIASADVTNVLEDTASPPGHTVVSVLQPMFSDPDIDQVVGGVGIVGNNSSATGSWQYLAASNNAWKDIGLVSDSSALVLKSTDIIRFVPATNYNGPAETLTVRVLDDQYIGPFGGYETDILNTAGSSISTTTQYIKTTVTSVNDSPELASLLLAPLLEDSSAPLTIANSFIGKFVDQDSADTFQAVAIVDNPINSSGQWQYKTGNAAWRDVGVVSSSNALILSANDLLQFVPDTHYTGPAPQLLVHAIDSQYTGTQTTETIEYYSNDLIADVGESLSILPATLDVDITPVNDPATITLNPIVSSLPENTDVSGPVDVADIVINDVDSGANALSLSGMHAAYFQITNNVLQLASGVTLDAETLAQLDVNVVVDDASVGAGVDDVVAYSLVVKNIDEPPVIANVETTNMVYVENTAPTALSTTLSIDDLDSTQMVSATVRLQNNSSATEELVFTDQNGILGSYDSTDGIMSLTGVASLTDYENAIQSVAFVSSTENAPASQRMVYIQVNDGTSNSIEVGRILEFVPVNDTPTVALSPIITSIDENTDVVDPIDVADIVVSDIDNGANVLSLSGAHSNYFQIYGNKLQLSPSIALDTETLAQLDVNVAVNDASVGSAPNDVAVYSVVVTNVDEVPVLTGIETTNLVFIENAAPVALSATLGMTDPDSVQMTSAQIRLQSTDPTVEELVFTDQNNITGTYDAANGVLSLVGVASLADYEAAIQSVGFVSLAENASASQRLVYIQVNDGTSDSNEVSRVLEFVPVNDAPTLALNPVLTNLSEAADTSEAIDVADIVVNDVDGGVNALSLAGVHASLFQINGNALQLIAGVVLDAETLAQLDVTVVVDDASVGGAADDFADYNLTIDDANEAPALSNIEANELSFVENDAPMIISSSIVITDPESVELQQAVVQLVGPISSDDALLFTDQSGISGDYNESLGSLNLIGAASIVDYQNALRSVEFIHTGDNPDFLPREVEFIVSDGTFNSNALSRIVAIEPVNDAPQVTVSPTINNLAENAALTNATDVATIAVVDVDGGVNSLSLAGTNASLFQINGNKLQLKPGITFDTETQPQLHVDVIVDDASVGTDVDDIAIYTLQVTNVNESPVLSNVEVNELSFVENDNAVVVSSTVTATDVDSAQIESATVRIVQLVSSKDALLFTDQNGITGTYDSASGTMALTGSASVMDYQSALQSVMFVNNNDAPSQVQREVEFQVSDGVTLSNAVNRLIDVVPVNDEPQLMVNTGTTLMLESTLVLSSDILAAVDTDNDPAQLIYSAQSTLSDIQILVNGVEVNSFSQQDVDDALVTFSSVGSSGGELILPLLVSDGQGGVTTFDMNVNVSAIPVVVVPEPEPEPEPVVAAAQPESLDTLEELVLSELPPSIANTPIVFEPIELESVLSVNDAVEDDKQPVIGEYAQDEQVEAQQHIGITGESIAVIDVPEFSAHPLKMNSAAIFDALAAPVKVSQNSLKLSDIDLMEEQMASLLSLEPLTVSELTAFENLEDNAGLQNSIARLHEELAQTKEQTFGNIVARDTVVGFTLSVTAGFMIWLLRGGALLASMFSISPLWRQLDPMPIVNSNTDVNADDGADDGVEKLFDDDVRSR